MPGAPAVPGADRLGRRHGGTGTVTVRGATLSVTARHTWRKPLRRGRIVVTVTDAATGGTLTIRRAVRIA